MALVHCLHLVEVCASTWGACPPCVKILSVAISSWKTLPMFCCFRLRRLATMRPNTPSDNLLLMKTSRGCFCFHLRWLLTMRHNGLSGDLIATYLIRGSSFCFAWGTASSYSWKCHWLVLLQDLPSRAWVSILRNQNNYLSAPLSCSNSWTLVVHVFRYLDMIANHFYDSARLIDLHMRLLFLLAASFPDRVTGSWKLWSQRSLCSTSNRQIRKPPYLTWCLAISVDSSARRISCTSNTAIRLLARAGFALEAKTRNWNRKWWRRRGISCVCALNKSYTTSLNMRLDCFWWIPMFSVLVAVLSFSYHLHWRQCG